MQLERSPRTRTYQTFYLLVTSVLVRGDKLTRKVRRSGFWKEPREYPVRKSSRQFFGPPPIGRVQIVRKKTRGHWKSRSSQRDDMPRYRLGQQHTHVPRISNEDSAFFAPFGATARYVSETPFSRYVRPRPRNYDNKRPSERAYRFTADRETGRDWWPLRERLLRSDNSIVYGGPVALENASRMQIRDRPENSIFDFPSLSPDGRETDSNLEFYQRGIHADVRLAESR